MVRYVALLAIGLFLALTAGAQDHAPGEQGSSNVHIVAHVPMGGDMHVGDIEIEQELSRPYAYVSLALSLNKGTVALTIVDDGIGFDPTAVRGRGGLGLVGMDERARVVNGQLVVAARPGRVQKENCWVL